MSDDWGTTVPADLPTETVMEIRDKLRAGEITIGFDEAVTITPEVETWRRELTAQLIVAYDAELLRRRS